VVPITLSGKGQWFRVMVGAFESAASADQAGQNLVAKGLVDKVILRELRSPLPGSH